MTIEELLREAIKRNPEVLNRLLIDDPPSEETTP